MMELLFSILVGMMPPLEEDPKWAGQCIQVEVNEPFQDMQQQLFESSPEALYGIASYFAEKGDATYMHLAAVLLGSKMVLHDMPTAIRKDKVLELLKKSADCGNVAAQEMYIDLMDNGEPLLLLEGDSSVAKCLRQQLGNKDAVTNCMISPKK